MKHSAYAFATEVDRLIEALTDEEFYRRNGRSKRLQEELLPLSRLALLLKLPGLTVDVEAFEDDGPADGHMHITGFRPEDFDVQVTYAGYEVDEALRDELYVSQGFTPEAGRIEREKKSRAIVATMGAVDDNENIVRLSAAIMRQFRKKDSMSYPQGTVLLVAFEEIKLSGRPAWNSLFSAIAKAGGITGSQFCKIYLFNGATNEIQIAT